MLTSCLCFICSPLVGREDQGGTADRAPWPCWWFGVGGLQSKRAALAVLWGSGLVVGVDRRSPCSVDLVVQKRQWVVTSARSEHSAAARCVRSLPTSRHGSRRVPCHR